MSSGGSTADTASGRPVDSMDRLLASVAHAPAMLAPGRVIDDTFEIVRVLGAGGMGVVYLARDLRLHRSVAIKLHASTGGFERAQREAKVMARLSHANVLTIHEVGVHEGRLYIAMEHVDGGSMRAWLDETPRRWGEVLDVLVRAGRGLAAAHDAGLIHRDFKPENVLRGLDGRVRVADFGLARSAGEDADGVGAGTPRYMSPEQRRGAALDARSDQYSFCITAREALRGRGPRWLRGVIDRGASGDPADRWPSMNGLLDAIERRRRRRRLAAGAAAVAAIALLALGVGWRARTAATTPPCSGADEALRDVWGPGRRAELAAALGPEGASVLAGLDLHASRWKVAHREVCLASHVERAQTEDMLDLRMACLRRDADRLRALVDLLRDDPSIRAGAGRAIASLPDVGDCEEIDTLSPMQSYPTDPARRARLDALQRAIAANRVLLDAGRLDAARLGSEALVIAARADGYLPLLSEALRDAGEIHVELGDYDRALRELTEAFETGISGGHDRNAIDAGFRLAYHLVEVDNLPLAESRLRLAAALTERTGLGDDYLAIALSTLAALRLAQGRGGDAVDLARRALADDLAHGRTISAFDDRRLLASALLELGRLEEADAALAPIEAQDPTEIGVFRYGDALRTLATIRIDRGDVASGQALHDRGLALLAADRGDVPSFRRAVALDALALAARLRGDHTTQLELTRQALEVTRQLGDSIAPGMLASELGNHAIALAENGRSEAALEHAIESRDLFATLYAADDPQQVGPQQLVGSLQRLLGRIPASIATLEAARALAARILPEGDPARVNVEVELAVSYLEARRSDEARQLLERALPTLVAAGAATHVAEAQFALARATWDSGGDHRDARTLAIAARAIWADLPASERVCAEVDRWLAGHGGAP